MTTNIRIWRALNSKLEGGNLNIIQNVLQSSLMVKILEISYFIWHINIRIKFAFVGP